MIEKAWEGELGTDPTMGLIQKIRSYRLGLMQWDRSCFGNIPGELRNLMSSSILSQTKRLLLLYEREETMWKQRGNTLWLKKGDCNTSFFHGRATKRRQRREIKKLKKNDGTYVERETDLQEVILEYFSTIFTSSLPNSGVIEEIIACIEPNVSEAMNEALIRPFTSEEVKLALDVTHPLKSPVPNDSLLLKIGIYGRKFFWDQDYNRKIHWVSWPVLCKNKEDSDLGFKRLCLQNLALLETGLALVVNPDGMAYSVLQAKYFPKATSFVHRWARTYPLPGTQFKLLDLY
ncbi:UNVERIFIED_CONTAM: hypothetical protein Sangu_2408700 [Sesamum angustifolium]|uniref:Uncharacterized protein n=1 Tax=Sesamum angustifolium TaxID=2727405 RepID=A0AAW2KYZ4_9LAMI